MEKNNVSFCLFCLFSCHQKWDAKRGKSGEMIIICVVLPLIKILYTLLHMFAISKSILPSFLQETVSLGNGWNRTTFQKSVPMSTYLVCFAVHQFKWVERRSDSGIPVSSITD